MDLSPCDRCALRDAIAFNARSAAMSPGQEKLGGNIVLHRENDGEKCVDNVERLNAFALPPQYYYLGPLTRGSITCQPSHSSCHVAPPRRSHGLVWPCHASAPPPRHTGARVGSRSSATWPCVPRRTPAGPAQK